MQEDFWPAGMAEPNRRVRAFNCVYIYEQSVLYRDGRPVPIDSIDGSAMIYIARDGSHY